MPMSYHGQQELLGKLKLLPAQTEDWRADVLKVSRR